MRRLSIFMLWYVLIVFFIAFTASADPRMEISDNFCHCILDPIDTDNEVFIADCQPFVTVEKSPENNMEPEENVESEENTEDEKYLENEIHCDGYTAKGYAKVARRAPEVAAPLLAGQARIITSEDSKTPCVMVDSNGREYKSRNWVSSIKVSRPNKNGLVWVVYELICLDGG